MVNTLNDLVLPESVEIPLLKNKVAVLGPLTFELVYFVEDKYGGFDKMQAMLGGGGKPNIAEILDLFYQMVENKDEFEDAREFARHVPLSHLGPIIEHIVAMVGKSMPDVAAAMQTEKAEGAKK